MIWWLTWSVLVVGTLVGAFFLGRSLWRRAVALGRELSRAGAVAGQLSDRVDELEAARAARTWVHPLLADEDDRAGWRAGIAERRAARRARREAMFAAAHTRWDALWR